MHTDMAARSPNRYISDAMYKALVRPLELPLQQPLAYEEPDEPGEEPAWEPTVRVVVFDDNPLPRDSELGQQA